MALIGALLEFIFQSIDAILVAFWPYLTVLLIFAAIGLLKAHSIILFIISSVVTSIFNIILFILPTTDTTTAIDVTLKLVSIASVNNIVGLIFYVESARSPIWIDFVIVSLSSLVLFIYIKVKDII